MAGPWLYVISRRSGNTFKPTDGPIPVTVDNFLALVKDGRIAQDRHWGGRKGIRNHWNHVEAGDDLFIYSSDQGSGIIGYAKITGKEERTNGRCLVLDFDSVLDKCRALKPGSHSITAKVVRGWGLNLRGNVIDLAPVEKKLRASLPWSGPVRPGTSRGSAPTIRRRRR